MNRKMNACWFLLWLLAALSLPRLPAEETRPAQVRTDRLRQPVPPNAIRISGEELQRLLIGATADDPYGILSVLSLKAGLTFRSTGDPGAENWFIVRNFGRDNSRLTLVVVDGRPVNLSNNFTVEFDDIPVAIIDSITVYLGPVPVRYGGFHTVIEIRTVPPHRAGWLVSAAGGSQQTVRANAVLAGSGRLSWLANLNFDRTMGQTGKTLSGVLADWTYSSRSATMLNPYLKASFSLLPRLQLNAHAQFVELEKFYGDGLHYDRPQKRRRSMQGFHLETTSTGGGNSEFTLAGYLNLEDEMLNARFPEDPTYNVHWGDQERQRFGALGRYTRFFGSRMALTVGGEAHRSRGRTNDDYSFFRWISHQSHYGPTWSGPSSRGEEPSSRPEGVLTGRRPWIACTRPGNSPSSKKS